MLTKLKESSLTLALTDYSKRIRSRVPQGALSKLAKTRPPIIRAEARRRSLYIVVPDFGSRWYRLQPFCAHRKVVFGKGLSVLLCLKAIGGSSHSI